MGSPTPPSAREVVATQVGNAGDRDWVTSMLVQDDGRIVAAVRETSTTQDLAAARYLPADSSTRVGENGIVVTPRVSDDQTETAGRSATAW